ncbi:MAG: hypothetical protein IGR76_09575 [Synechococcales cyanobacterium T60_A2020_003]|nr:hypothetical protein [Synechococcales cyanobacterium T60_A2020_003]
MMNGKAIRQWIAGSVAIGLGVWSASADGASIRSSRYSGGDRPIQVAQQADTCRRADVQIGIYQEPNATSPAVGVIGAGDYMRLGSGSGGGWVRITAPAIGWVEAKYLLGNDSTPCPPSLRPATPTPEPDVSEPGTPAFPPANQPSTSPPPSAIVEAPDASEPLVTRVATCRVTPQSGLVVRSRPLILSITAIGTLPSGLQTIEFTDRTLTTETAEGTRQWVYILSPQEGWISPGFVGDNSNLVGSGCSIS